MPRPGGEGEIVEDGRGGSHEQDPPSDRLLDRPSVRKGPSSAGYPTPPERIRPGASEYPTPHCGRDRSPSGLRVALVPIALPPDLGPVRSALRPQIAYTAPSSRCARGPCIRRLRRGTAGALFARCAGTITGFDSCASCILSASASTSRVAAPSRRHGGLRDPAISLPREHACRDDPELLEPHQCGSGSVAFDNRDTPRRPPRRSRRGLRPPRAHSRAAAVLHRTASPRLLARSGAWHGQVRERAGYGREPPWP